MDNLNFHLDAVVSDKNGMSDFDGPLHLILMLLSKNKIEVRDIQISLILEQYLEFISKMQRLDLEIASEFVQMAAHLIYIKTRMLLTPEPEEVSELDLLIESLEKLQAQEVYAGIKETVEVLAQAYAVGSLRFTKPPEPQQKKYGSYAYRHDVIELLRALSELYSRGSAAGGDTARPMVPPPESYSIADKSRELMGLLSTAGYMSLAQLYAHCKSRSELVAAFVSILELCAEGSFCLRQEEDGLYVGFSGGDPDEILKAVKLTEDENFR